MAASLEAAEKRFNEKKDELWKYFVKVREDVLHGRTPVYNISAGNKHRSIPVFSDVDIKRWQSETWQMTVDLDMPNLKPQAVQFAILDKDPVPDFIATIKRMKKNSLKQLEKADNKARKEQLNDITMIVSWDSGFKNVSGDRLYLHAKTSGTGFFQPHGVVQ